MASSNEKKIYENMKSLEEWAFAGLSQKEMAEMLGMAYSTFRKLKGEIPALSALLKKSADFLKAEQKKEIESVEVSLLNRCLGYNADIRKHMKVKKPMLGADGKILTDGSGKVITEEVLEEVHGAGGIAVLAHPAFYDNFDEIEKYIDLGLDGIEVWHPSATEDDVHRLTEICKAHDLLMTGGSDFHGIYGAKTVTLGTCTTPQEWVDKLLGYKAKKKRAQRRAGKEAAARAAAQTQE